MFVLLIPATKDNLSSMRLWEMDENQHTLAWNQPAQNGVGKEICSHHQGESGKGGKVLTTNTKEQPRSVPSKQRGKQKKAEEDQDTLLIGHADRK